jgi:hypothetical protein
MLNVLVWQDKVPIEAPTQEMVIEHSIFDFYSKRNVQSSGGHFRVDAFTATRENSPFEEDDHDRHYD